MGGTESAQLSELEQDALNELCNLGMGMASARLSELCGREVGLDVPVVGVSAVGATFLSTIFPADACAVHTDFEGPFRGESFLVFSEDEFVALTGELLGDEGHLEHDQRADAMEEVSNIVQHATLGTIGDEVGEEFELSLPSMRMGTVHQMITAKVASPLVLTVRLEFRLGVSRSPYYLLMVMEETAMPALRDCLQKYVAKISGE